MNAKFVVIVIAAVLLTTFFIQVRETQAAKTLNFTLYGSYSLGWGFTEENITSPGPTIVVEQGDTVNLTLISIDATHRFFVSYTNATSPGPGDPQSADFSGGVTAYFNFTATNTVGTYMYRCYYHPTVMWGYFQVVPTGTIPELQPLAMLILILLGTAVAVFVGGKKRPIPLVVPP